MTRPNPSEHHENAADHYENAAYQHREAARHHKSGNVHRAAHHAHAAHGHALHAERFANKASKSHAMKESGMDDEEFGQGRDRSQIAWNDYHSRGEERSKSSARMSSRNGKFGGEGDEKKISSQSNRSPRQEKSRGKNGRRRAA